MDSRYLPIKDQLELAVHQAMKDDMAVDRIDLSYDAMDRLMATDPLGIHHKSFGNIEWNGISVKPVGDDVFGGQYHLITRPLKGHTIRGKLP